MSIIETTKMSSKGQVVIPENIRKKLGLKHGSQFIVVGDKDVVILKSITPPSMDEFEHLVSQIKMQAKEVGLKENDIHEAIKRARGKI
ncbi:AbrB/MazE/SpoVT family DNA-binding domain-containing protein [candidate division KSB1 bacterium]|nr:AbrB/MazE/SpoVT family DNA-binding domain-containing protein [candidate division KSB1 bacterium]